MPTYASNEDVKRILQYDFDFTTTTIPSSANVGAFIEEAEDKIDQDTQHAWRSTRVVNEFYDLPYIPYPYVGGYLGGNLNAITVHLRHRNILPISTSTPTDKIEIWNGNVYEDWATAKIEGRANDYWLDHDLGQLNLVYFLPYFRKKGLRLTYRYGQTVVPKDIRRATALNAAIMILSQDDQSGNLNETGDPTRLNYDDRVRRWQGEINKIIRNRRELPVI